MAKKMKKMLAGAAGLMAFGSGAATPVLAEDAVSSATQENAVSVVKSEEATYAKVANIQGEFRYDQNVLSPSDSVFSLFGTAATAACAAPSFVFEDNADQFVDYYLNVGGKLQKNFQVSLAELKEKGTDSILKCSCAMSPSIVNVQVTGVPLANIVEMADLEDDINTVTIKGSDGYTVSVSLEKALEKNAMLVYKVGGEGLQPENGGPVQLWMPGAAANYFTRQVTDIEFTHADEAASTVAEPKDEQRAKISVLNSFEDAAFPVGSQISFEGYADDFDVAIAAIEFSMDGGETWTTCETPDTSTNKWVYWYFTVDAKEAGTYKLDVRARTAAGNVSPLGSSVVFTVE